MWFKGSCAHLSSWFNIPSLLILFLQSRNPEISENFSLLLPKCSFSTHIPKLLRLTSLIDWAEGGVIYTF